MAGENKELLRLTSLPRKEGEELRITLDEFTSDRGKSSKYVSLRIWFEGRGGAWLPGRQGITVRARELDTTIEALTKARAMLSEKGGAR